MLRYLFNLFFMLNVLLLINLLFYFVQQFWLEFVDWLYQSLFVMSRFWIYLFLYIHTFIHSMSLIIHLFIDLFLPSVSFSYYCFSLLTLYNLYFVICFCWSLVHITFTIGAHHFFIHPCLIIIINTDTFILRLLDSIHIKHSVLENWFVNFVWYRKHIHE